MKKYFLSLLFFLTTLAYADVSWNEFNKVLKEIKIVVIPDETTGIPRYMGAYGNIHYGGFYAVPTCFKVDTWSKATTDAAQNPVSIFDLYYSVGNIMMYPIAEPWCFE